jgi:hydroxybutyrate-dimer hydrolase
VDASGAVRELNPAEDARLFEAGGIPPTDVHVLRKEGIHLINDRSEEGPRHDLLSKKKMSPSTDRQDQNLDGARCLRALWDGERLDPALRRASRQLHRSIDDILATADLGGRPAVIVTGRADAVIAPNHASRAWWTRSAPKSRTLTARIDTSTDSPASRGCSPNHGRSGKRKRSRQRDDHYP